MARDSRMFDNRDASCVLSVAGMLKCKLLSLLKFYAAILVAVGELSLTAAASLVWREIPAWHLAWAFLQKCSLGIFPVYPEVAVSNMQQITGI